MEEQVGEQQPGPTADGRGGDTEFWSQKKLLKCGSYWTCSFFSLYSVKIECSSVRRNDLSPKMFHTCFKCTIWFFCHLLLLLCLENLARRTLQGLAGEAGVAGTLVQSSAQGEERPEQPVKPPPEGRGTGATRTFWRPSTGIFRQGEGGGRRRRQQRSFTRQLGDRGCSSGSQIPWNAATSERGRWCYNSQGEF